MKRKDDARDILWFLNKKKPMPAAESDRSERGIEKENQVVSQRGAMQLPTVFHQVSKI